MKKILSFILAALIAVSGFAFPAAAEDASDVTPFALEDITVTGGTATYDEYLSAVKVTPNAAGEEVTVSYYTENEKTCIWIPSTSCSSETMDATAVINGIHSNWSMSVGHKFSVYGGLGEGNVSLSYIPENTGSIYFYGTGNDWETLPAAANGSLQQYDEWYLDLDCYDVERYAEYYWNGGIVFNESFMVIEEEDGTVAPEKTLYDIDRVVSVRNSYLNKEYVYGKDYLVEDGKLVIPEGSDINSYAHSSVYRDVQPNSGWWKTLDGTYVYAGQYDMYFVGYLNVTYTTKDTWDGVIPESKGMLLKNFHEKLTDGNTVKVLAIGDSLAGGANVSSDIGWEGVEPYCERWSDMTASALRLRYPNVNIENETIAQGGATASLAIEKMKDIIAYDPDLLIIEFGTNECMQGDDPSGYINNVKQAIAAINENIPDCDIIVTSTSMSNTNIFPADWFYAYSLATQELEREGVAVADITSTYQYMLTQKNYIDMTGDNLCHPNDYSSRAIVHTIMKTLEEGTEEEYIAGYADRILNFRYENEFDSADWAKIQELSKAAREEILACTDAESALEAYIKNAKLIDAVPTSKENIANASLDISKISFNTVKGMDSIDQNKNNNVETRHDAEEKALAITVTNARTPYVIVDYTKGDSLVSADDYGYVVLTLKAPLTNGTRAKASKLTFTTNAGDCTAITLDLILDGEYHSYIVDMSGDAKWTGDIASLKLQVFTSSNSKDVLLVNGIYLATDLENANDIAIENEKTAQGGVPEAQTFLMSDDATTSILTVPGGQGSVLAGDVNDDGIVSAKDSLIIRRYIAEADGTVVANEAALDLDCDGAVDASDSLVLRKILSGVIDAFEINLSDADISYSTEEKAAKITLNKDNVTLTVDMTEAGLSADVFKYISLCAKAEDGRELDILVTLTTENGIVEKTVTIPENNLFVADSAKFIEAEGNITSVSFTIDAVAGETVYLDSFVFTPTLSAAENAEIVRVGAANLNS
ncbi:MAG: hypothetical protein IJA52_00440 [Clostridia bacterium]|nr:hypothetical protein [Clostridia bacterium]